VDRNWTDYFISHVIAISVPGTSRWCLVIETLSCYSIELWGIVYSSESHQVNVRFVDTCFRLRLPQILLDDPPFRLTHCDNATSNVEQQMLRRICSRNRAVILTLHKQHVDMIQHIRAALSHVYHLLPVQKSLSGPRGQKRSLLPIGGVVLSELLAPDQRLI